MVDVLILGGTGWLSGRIAQRWRDTGAAVTCLARGARPVPSGAKLVVGDRDDPDAYLEVARARWDEIIDVSSDAAHVRRAVEALGDRTDHWTYVSSVSVYVDDETVDLDESARRHPPARPGEVYDYGPQKVAAEDAVRTLGPRATIIRPGLIVGSGDPSDRFGYWAAAFDRAGDRPVLLPPTEDRAVQVIDVDDVAEFVVSMRGSGAVNAIGPVRALGDVLAAVREVTGHRGEVVSADDGWLEEQGIAFWMGERSLPLWLPADMRGFMTRSNAAYRAVGGGFRSLSDTIADVLEDERLRGVDRQRKSGLSRIEEDTVLDALEDLRSSARGR